MKQTVFKKIIRKNTIFQLSSFLLGMLVFMSCSNDDGTNTPDDDIASLDCSETESVFTINLNPDDCTISIENTLGTTSNYDESISGSTRTISINGIANHLVGTFPNSGNPNTIAVTNDSYSMTTSPSLASNVTNGRGYTFGVLFSGVALDPYTGEFFVGSTGITNMDYNIVALQSTFELGLDCNNAHVQPTGRYHYHGTPSKFTDDLSIDGSQMVKVGYAADGFPIYYKYGYNSDGTAIIELSSGYQLKTEDRGGNGVNAPGGCPDGFYISDWEYVEGISELDECNGRFGKTPEADDEYYYVITDNYPSSPLCFSGTPDNSFSIN